VVPEADLARVPEVVRSLLADQDKLRTMREAMLRAARPNAADEIAEELISLASA
jgi:UDP-N-acetylglucosamine:LPS N-acetylglucosamine transferase